MSSTGEDTITKKSEHSTIDDCILGVKELAPTLPILFKDKTVQISLACTTNKALVKS